jgi:putative oxidoreductase
VGKELPMKASQSLARPLLASMFVAGGIDSIRNSEGKVKAAEAVVTPLSRAFPSITSDTETLIKFNGAVQVAAGSLLAIGKLKRLSALALIGSLIPTTYAGHRFWEETDDDRRKQQWVHFLKNLGLLGGLILVVDTRKRPASRARTQTKKRADTKVARRSANLARKTKRLESRAEQGVRSAVADASKLVSYAQDQLSHLSAADASKLVSYAQDQLSHLNAA